MRISVLLLLVISLFGCEKPAEVSYQTADNVASPETRSGTVLESFDVEGYTYVRLEMQGQEVWLASTPSAVSGV